MENDMKGIEIAKASVIGRTHSEKGKNNQDSLFVVENEKHVVGIVADGCGSCIQSEIGAGIATRLIANSLVENINLYDDCAALLERIRLDVLAEFRVLINRLGFSISSTVNDLFLFTVIGFVITQDEYFVFSLGDGLVIINDRLIELGPFPDNKPPYLMYGLTGSTIGDQSGESFKINVVEQGNIVDMRKIVIGTDGMLDLLSCEGKRIPGKEERVPNIHEMLGNNSLFKNKDILRRKLSLINKNSTKYKRNILGNITDIQVEKGLLEDDTSMIIARRQEV